MKKIVCILLTLVMVMSLSVVAFADETPKNVDHIPDTTNIDVTASVSNKGEADIVYKLTVEWTVQEDGLALENTYTYTWSATTLKYEKNSTPTVAVADGKDNTPVEITITNMSNAAVAYEVKYEANAGVSSNVTSKFDKASDTDELTGTLNRADNTYIDYLNDGSDGKYTISSEHFEDMEAAEPGTADSATVSGTVSITAGNTAAEGNTIKVGTFTVSLSSSSGGTV